MTTTNRVFDETRRSEAEHPHETGESDGSRHLIGRSPAPAGFFILRRFAASTGDWAGRVLDLDQGAHVSAGDPADRPVGRVRHWAERASARPLTSRAHRPIAHACSGM